MIRHKSDGKRETRANMRGGQGTVQIAHYFQSGEFGAAVRLCARLTLPPGASIGTHEHIDEDEVYIVLSGSGLLEDGEQRTRISPGDSVLSGSGGQHAILNDGTEPLELIAFIVLYPPDAEAQRRS